jgi:hypothetical protein
VTQEPANEQNAMRRIALADMKAYSDIFQARSRGQRADLAHAREAAAILAP